MKWGGFTRTGEERVHRAVKKLVGARATYYLLSFAALALLLAESVKWRPGGRG